MRQLNSVKKHKGKGNVKAHQVTLNNNKISKLLYFCVCVSPTSEKFGTVYFECSLLSFVG